MMADQPIPSHMTALQLTDDGPRMCSAVPVPALASGEALLRVRMAGVCSTDLALVAGYKGSFRGILGHEFVADVVALHHDVANAEAWLGARVVAEINIGCVNCALCRRGLHKHCRTRAALGIARHDGVFAEYVNVPVANLHRVPANLPDTMAVFCEPLAAALQIAEQLHIAPSMRIYVLGDGRLGLLVAMALQRTGADVTLIGRTREKLAIAALRGIATTTTDAMGHLTENPADVVVEVTGSPQGFASARQLVRPAGTIVVKSTFAGDIAHFDASALVVDEITLLGSRCGPFAPALELMRQRAIDPRPLIHATYPLARADEALAHAARKGVLKVLITMDAAADAH